MPASRLNYLVIYEPDSQVYGASSKKVALESPLPDGVELDQKRVFFITYAPEKGELSVHKLPEAEVLDADIKEKKVKKTDDTT